MLDERERLLVLGLGVEQLVDTADRLHHARKLTLAHLLFLKVNKLHLNAAFLKITLGLLGIEGLFGAKNLDIHAPPFYLMKLVVARSASGALIPAACPASMQRRSQAMFLPMFRMVARPSASPSASPGTRPNTLFQ